MEPQFIHLRTHSAYSLSQGAMKVKSLVKRVKELSMPAVAITDTNNMFCVKEFSDVAASEGVKPIIGCQFNLKNPDNEDVLKSKGKELAPDKILLYVQNQTGYSNIMHLMKEFYLNTQDQSEPQLTIEALKSSNEGLICLTGGPEGQLGRLLLENRKPEAIEHLKQLKEIFGDRLYIEISRIGLEAEQKTEADFIDLAYTYDVPLVATNEAFFFNPDMYEAHDALICIAQAEYLNNEDRKHYSVQNYLKSQEQMVELFKDLPEALENTVNIAKRCSFLSDFVSPLLPIFDCPDSMTQDQYLEQTAKAGLKERLETQVYTEQMTKQEKQEIDAKYFERLEYELSVIKKMGFAGYFLIVADFINWSKNNGVPVGPGRGSGAGSIVAWSIKITGLDPIKLDLLFERFLNPERINMPDFDVDFCQENRQKTIEYVQNKYGFDHVAQIITYGKLQAKAVIRDVGRVLQMPYTQVDKISKLVPAGAQGKNVTLQEALEQVPELEQMRVNDPQINKLFDIAMKLEGLYRHSGVHAAGVVIGDRPLEQLVPLYKDPRADMPVTQYDMKFVETTGLIKFDFLGLKTLTVIQKTVDMIAKNHGVYLDMDKISLQDKHTYELLQRGDTAGVFQFESAGMKDIHKQLKPDRFEDLIAIVSLYRPGPMDNIPSYIKRKHGEEEITYLHPALEPILKETYGIMIYQEQVMKIAQVLGGYTLGGADKLRKVMGKKQIEKIPEQRKLFVEGAVKNNISEETAQQIFAQMEKFASYGFNKSHAAAYALISYQTAYLKAHYPVEFMCVTMSLDMADVDKLNFFKEECKKASIKVLPPDVNLSEADFCVQDGAIRYALSAIKGNGMGAMLSLQAQREQKGAYKSISDFIHRSDSKMIGKKQLEVLIKSGAFDSLDSNRAKLFENLELILKNISASSELKTSSQSSLFSTQELHSEVKLKDVPDWTELERLGHEAEVIGFYLSAHPLDSYAKGLEKLKVNDFHKVFQNVLVGSQQKAKVGACIGEVKRKISKTGKQYARVTFSDTNGNYEALLFADRLEIYEPILTSGSPVLMNVTLDKQTEDSLPRIMINSVEYLDKVISENAKGFTIEISDISAVEKLKEVLARDKKGTNVIYIKPMDKDWEIKIELAYRYALSDNTLGEIKAIQGISKVEEL